MTRQVAFTVVLVTAALFGMTGCDQAIDFGRIEVCEDDDAAVSSITFSRLTSDSAYDAGPAWSPDGSMIAFSSDRRGNQDIWTISAVDASPPFQLTTDEGADHSPEWSPDGKEIAFYSSRGDGACPGVWKIPSDGGEATLLAVGDQPAFTSRPGECGR